MPCWKWFNVILEEAGVEVTEENKERVDAVIHEYVNDRSSIGLCSVVMREASGQIAGDKTMRQELIEKVQEAARPVETIRD
jgi:GTP-binding protein EngB required for normal cell division